MSVIVLVGAQPLAAVFLRGQDTLPISCPLHSHLSLLSTEAEAFELRHGQVDESARIVWLPAQCPKAFVLTEVKPSC